MPARTRIKLSEEIDDEMKTLIKRLVKTVIIQKYNTFVDFCRDFGEYLKSKGKRNNFTDRVLSNKLNRGDIRFYEVIEIMNFLNYEISFREK